MSSSIQNYALVMMTPLPGALFLGVVIESEKVVAIDLLTSQLKLRVGQTSMERNVEQQLQHYFQGKLRQFALPLHAVGTPFQQRIWQALQAIPMGEMVTYGELATSLSSSPRAVANACRTNPIPLLVPCHRVVGKNGLGGYMGTTTGQPMEIKRWLLKHEGAL